MIARTLIVSLLLCCALNGLQAQVIATTEDGKKVVLKKDGTWQYLEDYMNGGSTAPAKTAETTEAKAAPAPTPKAITMDDIACGDIIGTRVNPQSQQENQALTEDMLISEDGDKHKFTTSLGVNQNKTYTWDMTIKGVSGCATKTPAITVTFRDGSSIKLEVKNDFVCDRQISLFLSRGLGNKGDLKKLRAKPISSFKVEIRDGFVEEDLTAEQGAILQKAFNCLNGK